MSSKFCSTENNNYKLTKILVHNLKEVFTTSIFWVLFFSILGVLNIITDK